MFLASFARVHFILIFFCNLPTACYLSLSFLSNAKTTINDVIVTQPECCNCILSAFLLLFVILPRCYFPISFSSMYGLCLGVFTDLFFTEELIFSFTLWHRLRSFISDILFFQVSSVAASNCSFCALQFYFSLYFSIMPRIATSLKVSPKAKHNKFPPRSSRSGRVYAFTHLSWQLVTLVNLCR